MESNSIRINIRHSIILFLLMAGQSVTGQEVSFCKKDNPLGAYPEKYPVPAVTRDSLNKYLDAKFSELCKVERSRVNTTVLVNCKGEVVKVNVSAGECGTELSDALKADMIKWKFRPGTNKGEPIDAQVMLPMFVTDSKLKVARYD